MRHEGNSKRTQGGSDAFVPGVTVEGKIASNPHAGASSYCSHLVTTRAGVPIPDQGSSVLLNAPQASDPVAYTGCPGKRVSFDEDNTVPLYHRRIGAPSSNQFGVESEYAPSKETVKCKTEACTGSAKTSTPMNQDIPQRCQKRCAQFLPSRNIVNRTQESWQSTGLSRAQLGGGSPSSSEWLGQWLYVH